jgi:hypothetical protein
LGNLQADSEAFTSIKEFGSTDRLPILVLSATRFLDDDLLLRLSFAQKNQTRFGLALLI